MCGRGAWSQVRILSLIEYLDLPDASCYQCGEHPKIWVPMESPKGLVMEVSSVIKKKKSPLSKFELHFHFMLGSCLYWYGKFVGEAKIKHREIEYRT